jgi:hypothetical protein
MSIELQIAILGLLVAVVIGAWQIFLAHKQVQASRRSTLNPARTPPAADLPANSENLLHRLWSSFDPELQDALSVAYNQAKREGKARISTRTFFAAVARLRPGPLAEFLDRLPEAALPEPLAKRSPGRAASSKRSPNSRPAWRMH